VLLLDDGFATLINVTTDDQNRTNKELAILRFFHINFKLPTEIRFKICNMVYDQCDGTFLALPPEILHEGLKRALKLL